MPTLNKLLSYFKSMRKFLKDGGHTTVNIAQISNGEILNGKRVLITGASSGIGLCIAKKCISEGANVLITGRNEEKLEKAVSEINSDNLSYLKWDISDINIINSKIEIATQLLGGNIDILVNNAGVLSPIIFPNVTEEIWDQTYSTNSKGLYFLTQHICKLWLLQEDRNKKVINISSSGGFVGATYPYRMTKWDINGLTLGLGRKLASKGIIVNGIAPGRIATKMQRCKNPKENIYDSTSFMQRYGLPEEIAELALFLISDSSNFITGQTIQCDGGGYKNNS
ncbi:SDR family NAD(P)-dependent oxidoreductase [Saccharicrinis aurantiacus]|uniref:SDR family NAD(P)-dependent oxidoreductase n=1 Tax=Saccharicrinis aurantiacus TaxID=1849719 RepID=UPI002491DA30|nr:SDR family oxidoreductase [Saccharicrinis aurantiacus]